MSIEEIGWMIVGLMWVAGCCAVYVTMVRK